MAESVPVAVIARQALTAGDARRARRLLSGTAAAAAVETRAELLRVRAQIALSGAADAEDFRAIATEALALVDDAPISAALSLADAASLALYQHEPLEARALLGRARALADADTEAQIYVNLVAGLAEAFAGDTEAAVALLEPMIEPVARTGEAGDWLQVVRATVVALGALEQFEACNRVTQRAVHAARAVNATGYLPLLLALRSNAAYLVDDHTTALLAAVEAIDLAQLTEQPAVVAFGSCCAGLVEAARGHREAVTRHLERARDLIPPTGMHVLTPMADLAVGLLGLTTGDHAGAVAAYRRVQEQTSGPGNRSGVLQWRADQIEALWRAGRDDEARERLAAFDDELQSCRLPRSTLLAARCHAILDVDGWGAQFATALGDTEATLPAFESGRTQLLWAERLLGVGRADEAVARAAKARQLFQECGVTAWARMAERLAQPASSNRQRPALAVQRIRTLGDFQIEREGRPVAVKHGVPLQALKVVLAFGGRAPVEQLADTLWPGVARDEGRSRLRNVIARSRSQFGPVLRRDGELIVVDPAVEVDAAVFERQALAALALMCGAPGARPAVHAAVGTYGGEFLPLDRYLQPAASPRERLRRLHLALLDRLVDECVACTEPMEAVEWLERGMAVDEFDDARPLRAAQLLVQTGRYAAAADMLLRARRIAADLDVPISPAVIELESRLHHDQSAGHC